MAPSQKTFSSKIISYIWLILMTFWQNNITHSIWQNLMLFYSKKLLLIFGTLSENIFLYFPHQLFQLFLKKIIFEIYFKTIVVLINSTFICMLLMTMALNNIKPISQFYHWFFNYVFSTFWIRFITIIIKYYIKAKYTCTHSFM